MATLVIVFNGQPIVKPDLEPTDDNLNQVMSESFPGQKFTYKKGEAMNGIQTIIAELAPATIIAEALPMITAAAVKPETYWVEIDGRLFPRDKEFSELPDDDKKIYLEAEYPGAASSTITREERDDKGEKKVVFKVVKRGRPNGLR